MDLSLIVVDWFAPNPEEIRASALTNEFGTVDHLGHRYTGVGLDKQPELIPQISELFGRPIDLLLSLYRLGLPENDTTHWIHCDQSCGDWAGILYLNPEDQTRGGTAFWSHEYYGDRLNEALTGDQAAELNDQGNEENFWAMNGLVAMKFNRFIAYPTKMFHSRWPRKGWGETKQDGRLIWTCFFNLK